MVESVSYLNIKPLYVYHGNGTGHNSVSSFDSVLQQEVESVSAGDVSQKAEDVSQNAGSVSQTDAVLTDTAQTADNASTESNVPNQTTSAASSSLFRDPKTGAAVKYVDVSENPDRVLDTEKSSSILSDPAINSSTSVIDASSMKNTKYDSYFKEAAMKYGVSESLLKGIAKAESDFNPKDVSSAGAKGIMQLMPETAKELGVTDVFDPRQNILGGAKCIKQKLEEFGGDVRLALAAYNAGSGAVKRNGGVPSYCKTYINRVLSYKESYEAAEAVG